MLLLLFHSSTVLSSAGFTVVLEEELELEPLVLLEMPFLYSSLLRKVCTSLMVICLK